VRIHPHFRIHGLVQDLVRRVRRSAVTAVILLLLFGSVVVGKNVFLGQLEREVRKTFAYGRLRMSYLPPAIVLESGELIAYLATSSHEISK